MTIKDMRLKTGLTQGDFAHKFGIPLGTLRDWEQGTKSCKDYTLAGIRAMVTLDHNDSFLKKILKSFEHQAYDHVRPADFNPFSIADYDHDEFYKFIHDKVESLDIDGFYDHCPPDVNIQFWDNVKAGKELHII